jgi:hypothetical protein
MMISVGIDFKKNEFSINGVIVKIGDRILAKKDDYKKWFVVSKPKEAFLANWEDSTRITLLEDVFNYYDILKFKPTKDESIEAAV